MTRSVRLACSILSVGLLVAGYSLIEKGWIAVGILAVGTLWIFGQRRFWKWIPIVGLLWIFCTAALGLFLGIPYGFMIPAALSGFLAWDLAEFAARLHQAAPEDDTSTLERIHLRRMIVLTLSSGGMCVLALSIQFKISFEWIVFLMFLALGGIVQTVNWLLGKDH